MKFNFTEFEGLYVVEPRYFGDDRGWFLRTYDEELFKKNIPNFDSKWIQMNHSFNQEKGTWRGLHYQLPPFQETKLVRCIAGSALDIVVDIRKNSKTFLKTFQQEISSENKKMIFIPKGFAHGFLTLEENTELVYLHDEIYHLEYEKSIKFDDEMIDLKLPFYPINLSPKDQKIKLLTHDFEGI